MLVAILVVKASTPFLAELFGETIRQEGEDDLLMPALLDGYFFLTLFYDNYI